ncbi:hypothetical protein B566_EDAN019288 [Ephemera danica]|nr:hypothetical protein B566_EDAN019288 [Ephemera danica]
MNDADASKINSWAGFCSALKEKVLSEDILGNRVKIFRLNSKFWGNVPKFIEHFEELLSLQPPLDNFTATAAFFAGLPAQLRDLVAPHVNGTTSLKDLQHLSLRIYENQKMNTSAVAQNSSPEHPGRRNNHNQENSSMKTRRRNYLSRDKSNFPSQNHNYSSHEPVATHSQHQRSFSSSNLGQKSQSYNKSSSNYSSKRPYCTNCSSNSHWRTQCPSLTKNNSSIHHSSAAVTENNPEIQNGLAERFGQTVLSQIRVLLIDSGFPIDLWADLAVTSAMILNRTPSRKLNGSAPAAIFCKNSPSATNVEKFKRIGSLAYAAIPTEFRQKLAPNATKCFLVGYSHTQSAYKLLAMPENIFFLSRDAIFDEKRVYKNYYASEKEDSPSAVEFFTHLEGLTLNSLPRFLNYASLVEKYTDDHMSGCCDADWAGDTSSSKSQSGYIIYFGGSPISWRSTQQRLIALSTVESEYMALTLTGQEISSLQLMVHHLWPSCNSARSINNSGKLKNASVIRIDNAGAISLATSGLPSAKTRHMRVRFSFIKNLINEKLIELRHTPTHDNESDVFTKGLDHVKHLKFSTMCGLTCVSTTSKS